MFAIYDSHFPIEVDEDYVMDVISSIINILIIKTRWSLDRGSVYIYKCSDDSITINILL